MAKKNITEIVATIVAELTPLGPEERQRVVQASLTLLGDAPIASIRKSADVDEDPDGGTLPIRARTWMKQNGLSLEQLHQVFHITDGDVEIIAADVPGDGRRERVRNAYVLLGIARLLSTGDAQFDDAGARALCERSGFYDQTNHMKYMRGGNEFTGSKDKGWTLTAPGLKHGAGVVKTLISSNQ
jgi:hypothetical protein